MSVELSSDLIALIATKTSLSFDKVLDHVQAQVMGFIQRKSFFKLATKQNVVILGFPTPDQRFTPMLQASLMRVDLMVTFSGTAPKLLIRTYDSQTTSDEEVLNGAQFTTKVSKSFDKQMIFGERYNFFFDQDCTIQYMKITEIPVNS